MSRQPTRASEPAAADHPEITDTGEQINRPEEEDHSGGNTAAGVSGERPYHESIAESERRGQEDEDHEHRIDGPLGRNRLDGGRRREDEVDHAQPADDHAGLV